MTKKGIEYIRWLQAMARRSKRVRQLADGGLSQAKIARKVGISRQRVHQIVNGK